MSTLRSMTSHTKIGLHERIGVRINVDQRNIREHVQRLRIQDVGTSASALSDNSQANFGCLFAFLLIGRTCEDTEISTLCLK